MHPTMNYLACAEYIRSTDQTKENVTFYHFLVNEICFFACLRHLYKFPCQSKTFLLPICLLCACRGRERVFPFFLRLAALCMVLLGRFKIFLGQWISGSLLFPNQPIRPVNSTFTFFYFFTLFPIVVCIEIDDRFFVVLMLRFSALFQLYTFVSMSCSSPKITSVNSSLENLSKL